MTGLWGALLDHLPGNWVVFKEWVYWEFLFKALWLVTRMAFIAIVLSIAVGTIMAVARLAPVRGVRWAATTYVEGFRATPLLLLLFFVFFGGGRVDLGWLMDIPFGDNFVDDAGWAFYKDRPHLRGLWRARSHSDPSWAMVQDGRTVKALWRGGRGHSTLRGEFRGTIVSRDNDSAIQGFVRITEKGKPTISNQPMTMTWNPKKPKQIKVPAPAGPLTLHGGSLAVPSTRNRVEMYETGTGRRSGKIKTKGPVQSSIRPRSGGIIRRDIMESAGVGPIVQATSRVDIVIGLATPRPSRW